MFDYRNGDSYRPSYEDNNSRFEEPELKLRSRHKPEVLRSPVQQTNVPPAKRRTMSSTTNDIPTGSSRSTDPRKQLSHGNNTQPAYRVAMNEDLGPKADGHTLYSLFELISEVATLRTKVQACDAELIIVKTAIEEDRRRIGDEPVHQHNRHRAELERRRVQYLEQFNLKNQAVKAHMDHVPLTLPDGTSFVDELQKLSASHETLMEGQTAIVSTMDKLKQAQTPMPDDIEKRFEDLSSLCAKLEKQNQELRDDLLKEKAEIQAVFRERITKLEEKYTVSLARFEEVYSMGIQNAQSMTEHTVKEEDLAKQISDLHNRPELNPYLKRAFEVMGTRLDQFDSRLAKLAVEQMASGKRITSMNDATISPDVLHRLEQIERSAQDLNSGSYMSDKVIPALQPVNKRLDQIAYQINTLGAQHRNILVNLTDTGAKTDRNDHSIQALNARYNAINTSSIYERISTKISPHLQRLHQDMSLLSEARKSWTLEDLRSLKEDQTVTNSNITKLQVDSQGLQADFISLSHDVDDLQNSLKDLGSFISVFDAGEHVEALEKIKHSLAVSQDESKKVQDDIVSTLDAMTNVNDGIAQRVAYVEMKLTAIESSTASSNCVGASQTSMADNSCKHVKKIGERSDLAEEQQTSLRNVFDELVSRHSEDRGVVKITSELQGQMKDSYIGTPEVVAASPQLPFSQRTTSRDAQIGELEEAITQLREELNIGQSFKDHVYVVKKISSRYDEASLNRDLNCRLALMMFGGARSGVGNRFAVVIPSDKEAEQVLLTKDNTKRLGRTIKIEKANVWHLILALLEKQMSQQARIPDSSSTKFNTAIMAETSSANTLITSDMVTLPKVQKNVTLIDESTNTESAGSSGISTLARRTRLSVDGNSGVETTSSGQPSWSSVIVSIPSISATTLSEEQYITPKSKTINTPAAGNKRDAGALNSSQEGSGSKRSKKKKKL